MCKEIEIFEGHSISITFVKYILDMNDNKVPDNFTGAFTCKIFSDSMRQKEVMSFDEVDSVDETGLHKTGNQIELFVTKTDNILKQNQYFVGLFNDKSETVSYPEVNATITVKPSR